MALLSIGKRKKFFSEIGLGEYNKGNILKLQKKYFIRKKDIDGIYGKDTDALLRHIVNVHNACKNFTPEEFKCDCGGEYCTGYPTRMREKTLKFAQSIRDKYGKPMIITSGLRCKGRNSELSGSVKESKHMSGMAFDWYMSGITDTLTARKLTINTIKKMKNHDYSYGNGIDSLGYNRSASYMGNALHTQTK